MQTFNELFESLNNPYPATLQKDGKQGYRSSVKLDDGGQLNINIEGDEHIDDYDHIDWEISFERNGEQSMTGEGDALRIMATVFKVVNQFVKIEKPKYMNAAAGKQKGNKKLLQGRERLYKRLLTKNLGRAYKISTDTSSSGTMFNMVRK
jgi:hypothetical protein